jgi:MFS transporter, NNP family, nitrate/nitrite transporter
MPEGRPGHFNFFSLEPRIRTLHLTWLAFFISFYVWFNHAPLLAVIRTSLHLTNQQVNALLILNVALTIPARVFIGMLTDKFGPRLMYTLLLAVSGLLCIPFALATDYTSLALSRFLLAISGAGFVVGIRMIGEWFPAKETGLAQGIYAGFGNFGSAAAAVTLPSVALYFWGENGWRWALLFTGAMAILYAGIYYLSVSDTPKGSTYFSPKKMGAMEVTSRGDLLLYVLLQAPLVAALALLAWKLGPANLKLLPETVTDGIYIALAVLYLYQIVDTVRINRPMLAGKPVPVLQKYKFRQVAVLSLSYLVTFGSELAVVSILPLLFKDTFNLDLAFAGFVGASFGSTTFFARPAGGWLSDKYGRRKIILIAMFGTSAGYLAMSFIGAATGVVFGVAVTFLCSLFVNAGNGAVYAMLPLIKRRLTGQIAGIAGAFGNVGGVLFLTIYSFVTPQTFFLAASATAFIAWGLIYLFIENPRGHIAEEMPDGRVTMIEVA